MGSGRIALAKQLESLDLANKFGEKVCSMTNLPKIFLIRPERGLIMWVGARIERDFLSYVFHL